MNKERLTAEQMKEKYPDMWVLLLNPIHNESGMTEGVVLDHSRCLMELFNRVLGKYKGDTIMIHTERGGISL